jgi:NAD(P)-dependent dehydrogenase (short-subunit alcohol dehydrogenase family)
MATCSICVLQQVVMDCYGTIASHWLGDIGFTTVCTHYICSALLYKGNTLVMNIVITGAGRGIGYETALLLAADANSRVIALSRNADALAVLQQNAPNGNVDVYACDIVAASAAEIATMLGGYGTIDILINNAGQLVNNRFTASTVADWQQMWEANVMGVVKMVQAVLPLMGGAGHPHIVNIGSMGGFQGTAKFPGLAAYSASKAAVANLTECLAEELKEQNIKVNCLALGAVNTEMLHEAFPGYVAPVSAVAMAQYIASFALTGQYIMNGKIVPVSISTP